MPQISAAELKVFRAANVNDLGTNGGRMSAVEIASAVVANIFPNVEESERAAGSTRYRKVFFKVHHDGFNKTLLDASIFQSANSSGDDKIQFLPGTQTDTQSAITGAERLYGCGQLDANVAAGATSLTVRYEPGISGLIVNGDKIRISNKASVGGAGTDEYATVSAPVTQVGDIATVTLSAPLSNPFSAANTVVSSVLVYGGLVPSNSAVTVTSGASGTYTAAGNLTLHNEGTIEQTYTLTFTSANAFDISGNTLGALGSGSTGAGAAPVNPDFAAPYFSLGAAGFGGVYQAGDTIVFTTHPASIPIWIKRVVPAGAAITAASTAKWGFTGGTT